MELGAWLKRIDRTREAVRSEFGTLSEAQLNWKPNAATWSIAQVLAHVISVNQSLFPIFDALIAGTYRAPFAANIPGLPALMGHFLLKSQDPNNRTKTKTLALWQPESSNVSREILDRFDADQQMLKQYLTDLTAGVNGNPAIGSPATSLFVYRLQDAKELLVRHGERHLFQAAEVKQQLPPELAA